MAETLSAEAARPEEREKLGLPAKSFKDALEEGLENGNVIGTGTGGVDENGVDAREGGKEETNGVKTRVLKVLDANVESKKNDKLGKNGIEDDEKKRPELDRLESKREFEAEVSSGNFVDGSCNATWTAILSHFHYQTSLTSAKGLDEPVHSPKRHKARKPSQKSIEIQPELKDVGDEIESNERSEASSLSSESQDDMRSDTLVSVDMKDELYEEAQYSLDTSKDEDKTLVSGRQAGQNWQLSGIRFAPWNIPLQRRLQTLAVLLHTLAIAAGISVFFFLCAIPICWPILLPYTIYCLFSKAGSDGKLTFRSNRLRASSIWSLFASYFPARLHRSAELSPTRKYIFGYHPHGIISHGAFAAFATEALGFSQLFPGITNSLLTLDSNFRIPIYREYGLAMGLASVSRESCENILSRGGINGEGMGRAITIVVGGARESLEARPGAMRLVLGRRYGFIKMALRTGADLVPVLAFGENDLYDQFSVEAHPHIQKLQLLVKKFMGFTVPLFHARGVFNYDVGLLPYRRPLNVVVGRPIMVTQNRKPSNEEIEKLHKRYCEELLRLWDLWKDDFAAERAEEVKILD
jgi:2-acylglycerol O-acyltransferase 2